MTENKLLPCPFCGGEASTYTYNAFQYNEHDKIGCSKCGVRIDSANMEQWNTRATVTPSDKAPYFGDVNTLELYAAPALTAQTAARIADRVRAALQQPEDGELVEIIRYIASHEALSLKAIGMVRTIIEKHKAKVK